VETPDQIGEACVNGQPHPLLEVWVVEFLCGYGRWGNIKTRDVWLMRMTSMQFCQLCSTHPNLIGEGAEGGAVIDRDGTTV
jgi:hypothetical protein